jgi:hypothetical protein
VEVSYLVEKWNNYDAQIFSRSLVQKCSLESTSLCLHTRLRVNKKFKNSHYFFEININFWLLCAHLVMTCIILHSRRPNCQANVCYALGFYVLNFFFRILRIWKARFSHRSFSPPGYVLKFSGTWSSEIV